MDKNNEKLIAAIKIFVVVVWTGLVVFLGNGIVAYILNKARVSLGLENLHPIFVLLASATISLLMVLPVVFLLVLGKTPLEEMGFNFKRARFQILMGLAVGGGAAAIVAGVFFAMVEIYGGSGASIDIGYNLVAALAQVWFIALAIEVIFRGFLQNTIRVLFSGGLRWLCPLFQAVFYFVIFSGYYFYSGMQYKADPHTLYFIPFFGLILGFLVEYIKPLKLLFTFSAQAFYKILLLITSICVYSLA